MTTIELFQDAFVLIPLLFQLIIGIVLSFSTRFIQFRAIPQMTSLLIKSLGSQTTSKNTVAPHRALFTAMSTTIGIGNIIGPLIAIGLGGPGALLGFLLATIFGGALTFIEVFFALKYKDPSKKKPLGGPMFYLNKVFPPIIGHMYAFAGLMLVTMWTAGQSNALAIILEPYSIDRTATGGILALLTIIILFGGIKRVAAVAEALVPTMFILYTGSMLWIIGLNAGKIPATLALIWNSAFSAQAMGSGILGGSLAQALRWGLAQGFQSNESGVGTSTIPHSLSVGTDPIEQGMISIISVFSNGILCLGSGLAVLVTGAYHNYDIDSINVISAMFAEYFPVIGPFILIASIILFVFSTILGNSFNAGQFFMYTFGKQGIWLYYIVCSISIFIGALFSVKEMVVIKDILLIPVLVPHALGLVILWFSQNRIGSEK